VNLVDITGTNIRTVWSKSNKMTLEICRHVKINLRSVISLEVLWTRTEVVSKEIHKQL